MAQLNKNMADTCYQENVATVQSTGTPIHPVPYKGAGLFKVNRGQLVSSPEILGLSLHSCSDQQKHTKTLDESRDIRLEKPNLSQFFASNTQKSGERMTKNRMKMSSKVKDLFDT